MKHAPIIILEGIWWKKHEVPLILPYFHALAISHRSINLSHRTIRNVEDIGYYCSKIPKNAGAMLYFACHGTRMSLAPVDSKPIPEKDLLAALGKKKEGAISFVHFGCCEMVDKDDRRGSHQKIMDASGAKWASGYTRSVNWLQSTFLDLALVAEVFVQDHNASDKRTAPLKREADKFVKTYDQSVRELGFSARAKVSSGSLLFPPRLR